MEEPGRLPLRSDLQGRGLPLDRFGFSPSPPSLCHWGTVGKLPLSALGLCPLGKRKGTGTTLRVAAVEAPEHRLGLSPRSGGPCDTSFGVAIVYAGASAGSEIGAYSLVPSALSADGKQRSCWPSPAVGWSNLAAPLCLGRASSRPIPQVPGFPQPGVALDSMWPETWMAAQALC